MTVTWKKPPMRVRADDDEEDECTEEVYEIKIIGNEVWFWGGVSEKSCLELTQELRKLEVTLLKASAEKPWDDPPSITLYIKTDGGCMFSGLSMMDFIWNMRINVTTVADGNCSSSGTFLLLGGHTRLIKQYSFVMIHQLSCQFWGKYHDASADMKSNKKFMKMAKSLYKEHTNLPDKKLSQLMKQDVYLSSEECVKWKVVHGIL